MCGMIQATQKRYEKPNKIILVYTFKKNPGWVIQFFDVYTDHVSFSLIDQCMTGETIG